MQYAIFTTLWDDFGKTLNCNKKGVTQVTPFLSKQIRLCQVGIQGCPLAYGRDDAEVDDLVAHYLEVCV